ncbi:MAG TPA: hypothetical protein VEI49_00870 [Terriglobales bacterium]|nr:hypothetical protein [Terriglobales bacterium]
MLISLLVLLAQNLSAPSPEMQQRAREEAERYKTAAIRINDLAGRIHSETDARDLVAEIAVLFEKELPPAWATRSIRERVARAEYESVANSALISEQRVADVWNEYVRQISGPDEALVTTAEIHNLRDGEFAGAQKFWARGSQQIWTVPNIYAVGDGGKVADGCRAIEAIRVIYDLYRFQNLQGARDRVKRGVLVSDLLKNVSDKTPGHVVARLEAHPPYVNPVESAERSYLEEYGAVEYEQLMKSLFDRLFPQN